MTAYRNNKQCDQSNEQIVTVGAKLAYEPPALTAMGKVEHLTALLTHGVPDLVSHGNIL
jgi:hypothetical protein